MKLSTPGFITFKTVATALQIVNISFQATRLNEMNGYVTMKSVTDLIIVAEDFVSKYEQKLTFNV